MRPGADGAICRTAGGEFGDDKGTRNRPKVIFYRAFYHRKAVLSRFIRWESIHFAINIDNKREHESISMDVEFIQDILKR